MNKVLILDFGSQYTQLIARVIRTQHVYCEIHPYNWSETKIREFSPGALVLSGSPSSIYNDGAPYPSDGIWKLGIPILGICYGLQIIATHFGGKVMPSENREYGFAELEIVAKDMLLDDLDTKQQVWMSHGDKLSSLGENMQVLAKTENSAYSIIKHRNYPIYGLQFHPEVVQSVEGKKMIANFLFKVAKLSADWNAESFIDNAVSTIREKVGNKQVILGLSGGVDSSVAATLLYKAIGSQLIPIFVDNGLMRFAEAERVQKMFSGFPELQIRFVDAGAIFLSRLAGVADPETKRKIIGATFIEVFEKEAAKYTKVEYLAQGTLYPDVIESVAVSGPSVTIKSHHNVGGLPEKMKLKLIEPLRELFKDEVREVAACLGLPDELINRHPFPGPGLAVRIIGAVDAPKIQLLQQVDEIFISELRKQGLYNHTWQAFAVLLPIHSVGVMGDERSYDQVCALRAVNSVDGMTADWTELPSSFLKKVSGRIVSEVKGISRVVYDITSKPPATIEWE